MSDDGLTFWAQMMLTDGLVRQQTTNRTELLTWIVNHQATGGELLHLGMEAYGPPALANMLAALAHGAAHPEVRHDPRRPQ